MVVSCKHGNEPWFPWTAGNSLTKWGRVIFWRTKISLSKAWGSYWMDTYFTVTAYVTSCLSNFLTNAICLYYACHPIPVSRRKLMSLGRPLCVAWQRCATFTSYYASAFHRLRRHFREYWLESPSSYSCIWILDSALSFSILSYTAVFRFMTL